MTPHDLYLSSTLRQIERQYAALPLMERAGLAAADLATELAGEHPILILAGPGNNGGDAFVLARLLRERFFAVHVVFAADPATLPRDAAAAFQRFTQAGGSTCTQIPTQSRWSLIVDGLFGIGLARAPAAHYADWIATANELVKRDNCPLLALDCPSGLNADSGTVPGECISASHTMTFISGKPGLLTADGPDHCGEIRLATLGLPADSDEANHTAIAPDGQVISPGLFASRLQPRQKNSHKGSFGGVGVIGGSHSMAGAALLAGRAALKLGAGRVYLGLLDPDGPAVDLSQPELMIRPVDTLFQADLQALLCGPGLGQSAEAIQWLKQALDCPLPLVLDADALNLLALDRRLEAKLSKRTAPAILTPHPAEAARLLEISTHEVQADRITAACALARRYTCPVALKGCGTVIAAVDGRWWINTTGNPGMATAGMGDVLSGLTSTLLAQNWPAELALIAAVHLHGAAADRLVEQGIGPAGMTAGEVIDAARSLFNQWLRASSA
ncbi:NAD(P)H-hydrate dehydratase [Azonexus sp.]|uniref:NAD(P)H-hydrate dehydratase n=1 Tax=Azonexus sp. TaxID=1872668 RepID=UPI0027B905FA|nr:NAD(P)H-hydrate dehydratase [Azonexus sp.]